MTIKQLGSTMRKLRGERSIREVAAASGMTRDQIRGIERGTRAYTMPSFLALCKALGVTMEVKP